ncbi:MAG: ABC transporter substrate-binding protein [Elusimicrobiota bacterium]
MIFKRTVIFLMLALLFTGCQTGTHQKEEVTLRFWHSIENPKDNRLLRQKIAVFEDKNPGIKIKPENIGAQDRAMPKIITALSADREPELLWLAPVYTGKLAQSGKLLKAGKFLKDPQFNAGDIYSNILESGKYKGEIYTLPFDTNNLAIYYNKTHFKEAGIKKLPRTWEEFRQAAIRLTQKDSNRYGFLIPMGTQEWTVWTWQTFLWQAGGSLLTDKNQPAFQRKPGIEALKFWVDLKEKDNAAIFSAADTGYKLDNFLSGRVSMMINGPWNYTLLKEQDEIDYGSFSLPKNKKRATNIGGENLYIFKSTEKKEEASRKFAKYVMSENFQTDWAIQTGYLPVNKKATQSQKYSRFLSDNPFMETFVKSMEFGKTRPGIPGYSRISRRIGRAIERALYQKQTPEEALKQAAEEVENL